MEVGRYFSCIVLLSEIVRQRRWLLPDRSGAHGLVVFLNNEVRLIGHRCYSKDKQARCGSCKCAASVWKPNGEKFFSYDASWLNEVRAGRQTSTEWAMQLGKDLNELPGSMAMVKSRHKYCHRHVTISKVQSRRG